MGLDMGLDTSTIAPLRWVVADVEYLPNSDGKYYEIIEGELFMASQPHWFHQNACSNLHYGLSDWNFKTKLGKVVEAPGIIFQDDEAVVPDVIWVSKERLEHILGEDGKLHAAPELVIEVLSLGSANTRRDKEFKRKLYSARGVNEYWIVDWMSKTVEIYRRVETSLQLVTTLYKEDELTSPILPNFKIKVSQIFE